MYTRLRNLSTMTEVKEEMNTALQPAISQRFASAYSIRGVPPTITRSRSHGFLRWKDDPHAYLSNELLTPRLDSIHRHLWCAGLPRPARPLHRQQLLGRALCITQRVEEHLVWHEHRIYLKPLPEYLLDPSFWEKELCTSHHLHQQAYGFLISYTWLISYEKDLRLAKEVGLVPSSVEWSSWQILVEDLQFSGNSQAYQVGQRYIYGELRLSRIELLHRYSPALFTLRRSDFGFMNSSTWYSAFVERHFKYLIAVSAYVSIILSAMQVVSAAEPSAKSIFSHSFFTCFATGAILIILAITLLFVMVSIGLCFYHVISTCQYYKGCENDSRLTASPRATRAIRATRAMEEQARMKALSV